MYEVNVRFATNSMKFIQIEVYNTTLNITVSCEYKTNSLVFINHIPYCDKCYFYYFPYSLYLRVRERERERKLNMYNENDWIKHNCK